MAILVVPIAVIKQGLWVIKWGPHVTMTWEEALKPYPSQAGWYARNTEGQMRTISECYGVWVGVQVPQVCSIDYGQVGATEYEVPILPWSCLGEKAGRAIATSGSNLQSSVSFPIGFACGRLTGNVTKSIQVTPTHCNHCNCKLVTKCLNHNRGIARILQSPQLWRLLVNFFSFSTNITLICC